MENVYVCFMSVISVRLTILPIRKLRKRVFFTKHSSLFLLISHSNFNLQQSFVFQNSTFKTFACHHFPERILTKLSLKPRFLDSHFTIAPYRLRVIRICYRSTEGLGRAVECILIILLVTSQSRSFWYKRKFSANELMLLVH